MTELQRRRFLPSQMGSVLYWCLKYGSPKLYFYRYRQLYFVTSFRSRQVLQYHDQSVNVICDSDGCLFCKKVKR